MAIRPITPSFKGLLVTPDRKAAVNTKYIMTMKEYEDSITNEPTTAILYARRKVS